MNSMVTPVNAAVIEIKLDFIPPPPPEGGRGGEKSSCVPAHAKFRRRSQCFRIR